MSTKSTCLILAWVAAPLAAQALTESELPTTPPRDEVMATPAQTQALQNWAYAAFVDGRATGGPPVRIVANRQDHSVLRFGQSCIDTPLQIGARTFARGLGTHANSEITLALPPGAKSFEAFIGIDNNFDTQGKSGSAQFSVEAGGRELFHSPTLRGGGEPQALSVALPPGTGTLVLKVDGTADGLSCDQADWAEARIGLENGATAWADDDRRIFLAPAPPFSFVYDGNAAADLLSGWSRTSEVVERGERVIHRVQWLDPKSGLRVSAQATVFSIYGAVEWLLEFENTSPRDTPLIENIQALDTRLATGYAAKPVVLRQISGDVCGERSFVPFDTPVESGRPITLAPDGGRSSNGAFPFFNVAYGHEGVIVAIGWSGQWQARLDRAPGGPTRLTAGLEKTRLKLRPGERIRSPRILVMPWQGDRLTAHQRFRRLLMFEYAPKQNGHPQRLPVALQCFDRYVGSRPEWSTEAGQRRAALATQSLGCDTHWLDAAWFPGGFPNGVGNWQCKPDSFPNGLKPISDACHSTGLNFLLWFEPERVAPGTAIAREHPDFVLGGAQGGLFKLNDLLARKWLTDLLSERIREFGLDTYRNDFNLDPLNFWRANDEPDRQGMTEIRYIEGLYAMWDELRARHPGLWIDNCASGGRRIDLETLSRSVPLWRSDTGCSPGHADWDQAQAYGVSLYLPLFTSCSWDYNAYTLRSAATGGAICQFDYLGNTFSLPAAQAALAEIKQNQKFWYGDFTPLSPYTQGSQALMAYQLHRHDLNAGIVLAFRRSDCPYPVLQTSLRGLYPDKRYRVTLIDEARHEQSKIMIGKELMGDFELRIPQKGHSLLVRYQPK
jgi:alpha-galactosidase